jgi:hypothetical protein
MRTARGSDPPPREQHPGGPKDNLVAPLDHARVSLRDAQRVRSVTLTSIADSRLSVLDALELASEPGFEPIARIKLRSLLMAQPGWGESRTRHTLENLTRHSRVARPNEIRVSWALRPANRERLVSELSADLFDIPPSFPFVRVGA